MERVRLMGRWWALRFNRRLRSNRGRCNPPGQRQWITIDADLVGLERLEVLIHEMTHAASWDVVDKAGLTKREEEQFVERWGRDLARALWQLGYRCQNEPASTAR